MNKYKNLIKKLPEIYQPIILNDRVLAQGKRNNVFERLGAIKAKVHEGQTILDVGSNAGFFSIELAKIYKKSSIISIESNFHYAKIQSELVQDQKINNVCVINGVLSLEWLRLARDACVFFDTVLLLSVVHHFDRPKEILRELSFLCRSMIIEMPDENEKNVCGKEKIRTLDMTFISDLKSCFEEIPYTSPVHTDEHVQRKYYYLHDENYARSSVIPYIGYPLEKRKYSISSSVGGTKFYKHHLDDTVNSIPGANLSDLFCLGNILYPTPLKIIKDVRKSINTYLSEELDLADVRSWNVILAPKGAEVIDCRYTIDLSSRLRYHPVRDFILLFFFLLNKKVYWNLKRKVRMRNNDDLG
jgi:SAM-dependent methyltransferase